MVSPGVSPPGPFGPPTSLTSLMVGGIPIPWGSGGDIPLTNGNYYFVSSVDGSAGFDGLSAVTPKAALFGTSGAYAQATAANGDVIIVLPGHTEAISASTAAATSGVQVVGIGQGALRPTFTLDTANTATIAVSAANQSFSNCIFTANFLSIAACFTLSTAKNFLLQNCLFNETSSVLDFLNIVKSTGAANTVDGLTLIGNQWEGLGTTSVNTFNLNANTVDRLTALGNVIVNATTVDQASLIVQTAGILTNLNCGYNKTYRKNTTATASLISVGGTTSTGFVYNNYTLTLDTATNVLFTTTVGLAPFNNYITGVVGASGFLIPAADS
jgi:hypothetical protein